MMDVFADAPFTGNPLPVVLDAEGLDPDTMLRITRWMNQSETTFLLPARHEEADYRVRIFTLERELPFAGHPTLGSCRAWLEEGGRPAADGEIVQECGAGLIRIQPREDGALAFAAPPLRRSGPVGQERRQVVLEVLGAPEQDVLAVEWADNGPGWIIVHLATAQAVLDLAPARHHPQRLEIGVVGPHPAGHAFDWEVRTFFSDQHGNLLEDPVTGSFNASAAQWLSEHGHARAPWRARQGTCVGRAGRVSVDAADGELWIGGRVLSLVQGRLRCEP